MFEFILMFFVLLAGAVVLLSLITAGIVCAVDYYGNSNKSWRSYFSGVLAGE
jgi:hypothetical protein